MPERQAAASGVCIWRKAESGSLNILAKKEQAAGEIEIGGESSSAGKAPTSMKSAEIAWRCGARQAAWRRPASLAWRKQWPNKRNAGLWRKSEALSKGSIAARSWRNGGSALAAAAYEHARGISGVAAA